MKTTLFQSLKNKYITTPVAAMMLGASTLKSQETRPPAVGGLFQNRTDYRQKHLEKETKELFFYMLKPKTLPFDTYRILRSKVSELKRITDPKQYPPAFVADFIKNQCISTYELANELETLSEKLSQDSNLETLITNISSFRNLCQKDLNTRYVNLCFNFKAQKYDEIFGPALENLETKISQQLINEFKQVKEHGITNQTSLEKLEKISISLSDLYNLNYEHPTPKLFSNLYPYLVANYPDEKYHELNRLPLVEDFFQEEILPTLSRLKPILNGDRIEISKFISNSNLLLNLNRTLNRENSTNIRAPFLNKIDSQLTNFLIKAVTETDPEIREKSLVNLKEQLLPFMSILNETDQYEHFNFLLEQLKMSLNANAGYEEIYYNLLKNSYRVDLNIQSIEKAQEDLAKVISGTTTAASEAKLKDFLSDYLIEATLWDCEFGNTVQSFTENSKKNPQFPKQNFWTNQSIIFQDLIKTVLTPNFSKQGLAAHSNHFIAEAFDFNKISKGERPITKDLIEANKRYLKAMNLFESIFLLAQSKINDAALIDRVSNIYYEIEKEIALRFNQPHPFSEFPVMTDEFILGKAYGHHLESQFRNYSPGINSLDSPEIPSLRIIKNPHSKTGFSNLNNIVGSFPDRKRTPSRLNFNFLGTEASNANGFLCRDEQAFILGVLAATPCHNANTLNLSQRLKERFDNLVINHYSDNKHLMGPEIKKHFVKEALKLIEAENPGLIAAENN